MKNAFFLSFFLISFSAFPGIIVPDSMPSAKAAPKGKFIITAGAGFNATLLNYNIQYRLSSENHQRVQRTRSTPLLNIMLDYKILDRLSVGIAAAYQHTHVYWNEVYHDHMDGSYDDDWTRLHFSIRGDYYLAQEKKYTIYCGLRGGYNYYRMNSTTFRIRPDRHVAYYPADLSALSMQVHFGFSYWFSDHIGLNLEPAIGYGGPYLVAGGITAKF